jgi:hypothetical protein
VPRPRRRSRRGVERTCTFLRHPYGVPKSSCIPIACTLVHSGRRCRLYANGRPAASWSAVGNTRLNFVPLLVVSAVSPDCGVLRCGVRSRHRVTAADGSGQSAAAGEAIKDERQVGGAAAHRSREPATARRCARTGNPWAAAHTLRARRLVPVWFRGLRRSRRTSSSRRAIANESLDPDIDSGARPRGDFQDR